MSSKNQVSPWQSILAGGAAGGMESLLTVCTLQLAAIYKTVNADYTSIPRNTSKLANSYSKKTAQPPASHTSYY